MIGLTQTTFPDLHRLAEALNVTLTHHEGGAKGYYCHTTRTITTRRGLSAAQYKCTLAHELGHAFHHDTPTGNGHYDQRQENRAWQFAANLLIDMQELENACAWHQGNLAAVADELEITQYLLNFWLRRVAA